MILNKKDILTSNRTRSLAWTLVLNSIRQDMSGEEKSAVFNGDENTVSISFLCNGVELDFSKIVDTIQKSFEKVTKERAREIVEEILDDKFMNQFRLIEDALGEVKRNTYHLLDNDTIEWIEEANDGS